VEVPKSFLSTLKAGFFSSVQTGLETALLAGRLQLGGASVNGAAKGSPVKGTSATAWR
jgi:hypothetical protein